MKKHFNKRLLALILSAILLICACPLSVFASKLNGMNTAAMPGSGGDGPPSDSTEMSDIDLGFDLDLDENFDTGISAELTEDIKLRDTFTKHYTDGNGKYYAVVFPEQVHYHDSLYIPSSIVTSSAEEELLENPVLKLLLPDM